jgi:general secretion pathway protein G
MNQFEVACGRFPTTAEGLRALIERPAELADSAEWRLFLDEPEIPRDPWEQEYIYQRPSPKNPAGFDIFSRGPDGQEGTEDDIPNPPAP